MFGKYDTETYSMTTFDLRGAKIAKVALGNIGLIRSLEIGREVVNQGDAHSFVIERVCFNSLDHAESWLPKPTGRFSDGKPYQEKP